jgi:hypothetical protein
MLVYEVKHWNYENTYTLGIYSTEAAASTALREQLDTSRRMGLSGTDSWDLIVHELDNPEATTPEYTDAQILALAYPDGDPGITPAPKANPINVTTTSLGNGNWYVRFN